jgi:hypothetical protein
LAATNDSNRRKRQQHQLSAFLELFLSSLADCKYL